MTCNELCAIPEKAMERPDISINTGLGLRNHTTRLFTVHSLNITRIIRHPLGLGRLRQPHGARMEALDTQQMPQSGTPVVVLALLARWVPDLVNGRAPAELVAPSAEPTLGPAVRLPQPPSLAAAADVSEGTDESPSERSGDAGSDLE